MTDYKDQLKRDLVGKGSILAKEQKKVAGDPVKGPILNKLRKMITEELDNGN